MPFKTKDFIVIQIVDAWGFDHEQGQKIRDVIHSCNPSDFVFISPGTFHVYFIKNKTNISLADILISKLTALKASYESFSNIILKKGEGQLLAEFSVFGKCKGGPFIGDVETEILNSA